jgi:hypothetical protein
MLELFAELADRRVSGGSDGGRRSRSWQLPCVRTPRRPQVAGAPAPERPSPGTPAWSAGAPEALLGLWTELAWRHCHAARGREGGGP